MSSPTISDVALAAGVSTATVSRVLSGSPRVSPHTASKVRTAAQQLGYRVNPIARALRKNATGSIGLIVPSISNPFFTMLVDEVEQHMVNLGLNLYLCTSRDDVGIEAARLSALAQGAVDGILVSPCDTVGSGPGLAAANRLVPVVQLDRSARDVDTDWVGLDDMHAMDTAIGHLASLGVRSTVLITSNERNSSSQLRTIASRAACTRHGVELIGVLEGAFAPDWGRTAVQSLLAAGPLPEAIVCADDQIATGVLGELTRCGVDVPGDVRLTGLDDIPHAGLLTPGLTTVRQPIAGIAAEAVRLLQSLLAHPGRSRAPIRTTLRGELVVRGSTVAESRDGW